MVYHIWHMLLKCLYKFYTVIKRKKGFYSPKMKEINVILSKKNMQIGLVWIKDDLGFNRGGMAKREKQES